MTDLLFTLGFVSLMVGLYLISLPLSLCTGGTILMLIALVDGYNVANKQDIPKV